MAWSLSIGIITIISVKQRGRATESLGFFCVDRFGFHSCLCGFRMFSPTRRLAFHWTEFSQSIPRESSSRSRPRPIYLRKCSFPLVFFLPVRWMDESDLRVFNLCVSPPLSYGHLCEMVDHVFPLLFQDEEVGFTSSETLGQCNYWSDKLPDGSQQETEEPQLLETSWGKALKSIDGCEGNTTQWPSEGIKSQFSTAAVVHTSHPHHGTDLTDRDNEHKQLADTHTGIPLPC